MIWTVLVIETNEKDFKMSNVNIFRGASYGTPDDWTSHVIRFYTDSLEEAEGAAAVIRKAGFDASADQTTPQARGEANPNVAVTVPTEQEKKALFSYLQENRYIERDFPGQWGFGNLNP